MSVKLSDRRIPRERFVRARTGAMAFDKPFRPNNNFKSGDSKSETKTKLAAPKGVKQSNDRGGGNFHISEGGDHKMSGKPGIQCETSQDVLKRSALKSPNPEKAAKFFLVISQATLTSFQIGQV